MGYTAVITVTSPQTGSASTLGSNSADKYLIANKVCDHIVGMAGGARGGTLDLQVNGGTTGVQASGTITFSSLVADDTITVGGVVFTAKVSPTTSVQFALGASDTAAAAAASAKINAHPTTSGMVTTTSALGVITVTAIPYGTIGNLVGLAISAHGSVSAATLASGANITANTFTYSGSL